MNVEKIHVFTHLAKTKRIVGNKWYFSVSAGKRCRDYIVILTRDGLNLHITPRTSTIVDADALRREFRADVGNYNLIYKVVNIPFGYCLAVDFGTMDISTVLENSI